MKKIFFITLLVFSQVHAGELQTVGMKDTDWSIQVDISDYNIEATETKPDGRRYLLATKKNSGFTVSVTLEKKSPKDQGDCVGFLKTIAASQQKMGQDFKHSTRGEFSILEFMINEIGGVKLEQKYFRACALHNDTYIDLNISKVKFNKQDDKEFFRIVDSIKYVEKKDSSKEQEMSSKGLFKQGFAMFQKEEYGASIPFFENALALERKKRSLDKESYIALIEELGLAYMIVGNSKKSFEIFTEGITQEPEAPYLYYYLACLYADKKDKKSTMENLEKAFKYKKHLRKNDKFRDPKTEELFQEFMKDPEFKKFADNLK